MSHGYRARLILILIRLFDYKFGVSIKNTSDKGWLHFSIMILSVQRGREAGTREKKHINTTFAGKSITNSDRLYIVWTENGEKWRMVIMSFCFLLFVIV